MELSLVLGHPVPMILDKDSFMRHKYLLTILNGPKDEMGFLINPMMNWCDKVLLQLSNQQVQYQGNAAFDSEWSRNYTILVSWGSWQLHNRPRNFAIIFQVPVSRHSRRMIKVLNESLTLCKLRRSWFMLWNLRSNCLWMFQCHLATLTFL